MQWNKQDITRYIEAQEYVDTLIIPLMPISLDVEKDIEKVVFQGELIKIFSNEIEKQFTGRVFLLPTLSYLLTARREKEIERINEWVDHCMTNPFTHIFFLTFDHHWKKHETTLNGNLLWFPAIQSGDVASPETQSVIKDQINQVNDLIKSYW